LTADQSPAATNLLRDELKAEQGQPVRGADDLPRRVGCFEFALEPAALVGKVLEASAGPLAGAVAPEELAMGVD
jgi:hypothetical protein